ncbi:hypothetical protein FHS70_003695 [Flammeovirga yaeyamensis]|nr:hypothetical protein [Flammeovirga yaeyamensis]
MSNYLKDLEPKLSIEVSTFDLPSEKNYEVNVLVK